MYRAVYRTRNSPSTVFAFPGRTKTARASEVFPFAAEMLPNISAPEKNISSPHHLPFFSRTRDFPLSVLGPDAEVLNKYEASQAAYLPRFVVKAKMAETEWLCGPSLTPPSPPPLRPSLFHSSSPRPHLLDPLSLSTFPLSPLPLPTLPFPSLSLSPISVFSRSPLPP